MVKVAAIFKIDAKNVSVLVDESNDATIRSPDLSTFQKGFVFNDFENGFLQSQPRKLKVEKIGEGYGGADGLVSYGDNLYLSDWKNGKVFKN